MRSYDSVESLIDGERSANIHIECGQPVTMRALARVRERYASRRCAYYLHSDRGFDRESVRSYLRFFAALAGTGASAESAMDHFGLRDSARMKVAKLDDERRALMNFARMSLFEPEVCFCEYPLGYLGPDARSMVLRWIAEASEHGTLFITAGQPLRDALLMPGTAWWIEDDRCIAAQTETDDGTADGPDAAGDSAGDGGSPADGNATATAEPDDGGADEVEVVKVVCKSGVTTLLFDPREIDFIESVNRSNYVSVRGERYQTAMTLDELESMLGRFGFFRCHRSYIVNVQKIAKMERFTRNSFNLTLSDAARSTIPLAKGRAAAMREHFGL